MSPVGRRRIEQHRIEDPGECSRAACACAGTAVNAPASARTTMIDERGTFRRSRQLIGCANGFRLDGLAAGGPRWASAQNEYFSPN
jgi:hypothetical protein